MIDFTSCRIDKTSHYEGSDQKKGIIYKDNRYMLKFSDRITTDNRNTLNSSYSNSVISEHICCEIIKSIDYPVQNTLLGIIKGYSRTGEFKEIPVVACENFIPNNYELVEFKKILGAVTLEKPGKIPKIEEIYEILTQNNEYFNNITIQKLALERYWDTFIIDALLGNFDRHGNNWGYLINKISGELSLAPIYDCGSCLYPQISDEGITDIINSEEEINRRIDVFPKAALIIDGEKIAYKEYINSFINEDCNKAVVRVYPKINLDIINEIIDNEPEISDIRKIFYKTMIKTRCERILTPAYEKLIKEEKYNNQTTLEISDDENIEI